MKNEEILIPEKLAIKKPKEELLEIINNKVFNDNVLYENSSTFHEIKVIENEKGRFLHYKDTYQAGFINTDFYRGNLPYINYFIIPYLMNENIEKILLIGLGTGKIVNDYECLFKNLRQIDVVDIEENIFEIAQNFFNFKPDTKFNFILQDGITYLRNNRKKYDLIVVDVANNDGIDLRFLEDEYFICVKKSLKKHGIFVSNMCASPNFEDKKNKFFKQYFPKYKNHFLHNYVFRGDYSDKIYYKCFFDIDERVIDITNVILISSNKKFEIKTNEKNIKKISKIGIEIQKYIQDLYKVE